MSSITNKALDKIEELRDLKKLNIKLLGKLKKYIIDDEFPEKLLIEVKKIEVQESNDSNDGGIQELNILPVDTPDLKLIKDFGLPSESRN